MLSAQIHQRLEDGVTRQGFLEDGGLVALIPLVPFLGHKDVLLMHMIFRYLKTSRFTGVFANMG